MRLILIFLLLGMFLVSAVNPESLNDSSLSDLRSDSNIYFAFEPSFGSNEAFSARAGFVLNQYSTVSLKVSTLRHKNDFKLIEAHCGDIVCYASQSGISGGLLSIDIFPFSGGFYISPGLLHVSSVSRKYYEIARTTDGLSYGQSTYNSGNPYTSIPLMTYSVNWGSQSVAALSAGYRWQSKDHFIAGLEGTVTKLKTVPARIDVKPDLRNYLMNDSIPLDDLIAKRMILERDFKSEAYFRPFGVSFYIGYVF